MDFVKGSGRWIPTTVVMGMVLLGLAPTYECKSELKLGSAVNIFKRFGFLSISMRVSHRSDTGWLFREPTNDLLQTFWPLPRPPPIRSRGQVPGFEGNFHMEFCDDAHQLLQAYFRGFTIEKVEKPWTAFSASWTKGACAENLGLDPTFLGDAYSYILVQLSRPRTTARMTPTQIQQIRLVEKIEAEVIPGSISRLQNFFTDFGTHYISSYTTGNALYQVIVYHKSIYKRIKNRFEVEGVASVTSAELMNYFSPWYADHTGKILSTSGNLTVQAWAAKQLKLPFFVFSFPCLVHIHTNLALLQDLDSLLGDEAMLQLELRSLEKAFAEEQRRRWFSEVLDNQLKLWGTNMCKECYDQVGERDGCPAQQTSAEGGFYD